jgi:hypothetical protein
VARGAEDLWMDYMTAFDAAFTDTTRRQTAQAQLKHLRMKDDDLDMYISSFKHLARDAGYDLTAMGTADLFALGLCYEWTILQSCVAYSR